MVISTLGWVFVGAAAWLAVAAVVGVLIGRIIRNRDEQVPADDDPVPHPADHPHLTDGRASGPSRVPGRMRQRRR